MTRELETPRLKLERFAELHIEWLAELAAIPSVMRFIGTGATWTRAVTEDVAANLLQHWERHGFGWRVARSRKTSELIGVACSNYAAEWTPGVAAEEQEIGWWLHPSFQGRGLASESARALRDEALVARHAPSVIACVHAENAPSVRVATSIGLTHDFWTTDTSGHAVQVLRLRAAQSPLASA